MQVCHRPAPGVTGSGSTQSGVGGNPGHGTRTRRPACAATGRPSAPGVDPTALVEAINQAQEERTAAQAQISGAATGGTLDVAEVYAMIDSIGDIAGTF